MQPGMVRTDLWNQDKTDVKGKWAAFITGKPAPSMMLALQLPCELRMKLRSSC